MEHAPNLVTNDSVDVGEPILEQKLGDKVGIEVRVPRERMVGVGQVFKGQSLLLERD